jgi:hypothetical protein
MKEIGIKRGKKKQGTNDKVAAPCITPKNQLKTIFQLTLKGALLIFSLSCI